MHRPSFDFERTLVPSGIDSVAGIDEAGRGALCGPVVAGAVIFSSFPEGLDDLNDSKQLSPRQREGLFNVLRTSPGVHIGVGIVGHEVIDRVNILQATMVAMRKALMQLAVRPAFILVDGLHLPCEVPCRKVIQGDTLCPSISAASVVAKVVRDRIMDKYDGVFPGYGIARHKGYGTPEHLEAIAKLGLSPVHRRSFSPCSQMELF